MAQAVEWSPAENDVLVEAYLRMLENELRGQPFVKTQINAELQNLISRSRGSIEYKFQNVSAVLRDHAHPFINGYKPASNYQEALVESVLTGLARRPSLAEAAFESVIASIERPARAIDVRVIDAPTIEVRAPLHRSPRRALKRDYVAIEASNRQLGLAGEKTVVDWERRRLASLGLPALAARVEHVSLTEGDGLGYDIRSFDVDGATRFIEVKTTKRNEYWPMMVSRNEIAFSAEQPERFHLYRLYEYSSASSGMYQLPGAIQTTCSLTPTTFEALPVAKH